MIRLGLYMLFLYTLVICSGFYINQAHGQEGPRSCSEHLRVCELSCTARGSLYWFACQGDSFNPDLDDCDRYKCICSDDQFRKNPAFTSAREKVSGGSGK